LEGGGGPTRWAEEYLFHNKNVISINTSYKKNDSPRLKTFY